MYKAQDLHPGQILLMVNHSWIDKGIQWATDNPYSHAAQVGDGELIMAAWPKIVTAPLTLYEASGWAFDVDGATIADIAVVLKAIKSRIGQPYGLGELAADAGRDIFHLPIWHNFSPGYYTCSGLVAWAWKQAGITLTFAPCPSPADLSYSPKLLGARAFA